MSYQYLAAIVFALSFMRYVFSSPMIRFTSPNERRFIKYLFQTVILVDRLSTIVDEGDYRGALKGSAL